MSVTKLVETALQVAEKFKFLMDPASNFVVIKNLSGKKASFKTYDEKDTVQAVPYQNAEVGDHDEFKLQARGTKFINVWHVESHTSHTPNLGGRYVWNGSIFEAEPAKV